MGTTCCKIPLSHSDFIRTPETLDRPETDSSDEGERRARQHQRAGNYALLTGVSPFSTDDSSTWVEPLQTTESSSEAEQNLDSLRDRSPLQAWVPENAEAEEQTAPSNTTVIGSEEKRESGEKKLEPEDISCERSTPEEKVEEVTLTGGQHSRSLSSSDEIVTYL